MEFTGFQEWLRIVPGPFFYDGREGDYGIFGAKSAVGLIKKYKN